jgi:hypothetical protein
MSSGAELSQSSIASAPRVRVVVGASLSQRAAAEIPVRAALGAAASSSSSQSSASAAASVVPPSNAASQLPFATKTTLFDLCDSSYMKKKVKRQRKDKSAGGAAAAAASSSSASARPAQKLSQRRLPPPVEEARGIGPQVELVNGNIVLKESSLVMPDPAGDEEEYDDVINSAAEGGAGGAAGGGPQKPATYNSFLKRKSGSRWGVEETWLFYKALRQCGTEFSLMQSFFPGRTRKQLKQKFIKEEREHPELVRRTLDHSTPLEMEPFRAQFGALQGKEAKAASKEAAREDDAFVPSLSSSSSSSSRAAAAAANDDDDEDDNDDEDNSVVGRKRAAPDAAGEEEEEEEGEGGGLFDV